MKVWFNHGREYYVAILNASKEYPVAWENAHILMLNEKENNLTKMTNCNPQRQI